MIDRGTMSEQVYAISKYLDVEAVYARLKVLTDQPVRPIKRDVMEQVLAYFDQKCVKSKALTDEAKTSFGCLSLIV